MAKRSNPLPAVAEPQPAEAATMLLDAMLSMPAAPADGPVHGLIVGWIAAFDAGQVSVLLPTLSDTAMPARSLCLLQDADVGAQCAVQFESGDVARPIVMGLLQHPVLPLSLDGEAAAVQERDGSLQIQAEREIVLHCGKASIRLTREGRVELRGTTVVSHASGLNRVRGGSVKLN